MIPVVTLIVILILMLIANRIATVALTLTGLSEEVAKFQARSAFTGCGFTTRESEQVANHPVRRRIVMMLMLLGNAGTVTAVASLILTFVSVEDRAQWGVRLGILAAGLAVLWIFTSSYWAGRLMSRAIRRALMAWTSLDVRDYDSLLRLSNNYSVSELQVEFGDWLANRKLSDLGLNVEGVTVLGIQRENGTYIAVPTGSDTIQPQDTLVLYGHIDAIGRIDRRPAGPQGDEEHRRAVAGEI